jgi:hypothetical protein
MSPDRLDAVSVLTFASGQNELFFAREALDNPADLRDDFLVIAGLARVHGRQAARIR